MQAKNIYQLKVDQPTESAVALLANESGQTKSQIKTAMQKGAVWVKRGSSVKRLRRVKKALSLGDELFFYYAPDILAQVVTPAELVADEKSWSVWFKPVGMFSQGSKWGDHCTLSRYVERHLKPERSVYPVHRLDRATSGLMLMTHNKSVASLLVNQFVDRKVDKYYQALVSGNFNPLLEEGRRVIDEPLEGKSAITEITAVSYDSVHEVSLLDIRLFTGRKHQIRQHLSQLGYAIIGDRLYGDGGQKKDLQLQSVALAFNCPVSGERRHFAMPVEKRLCITG